MVTRIVIFSALLVTAPAWPQSADTGGSIENSASSAQMLMPPPVSAVGFTTVVGAEERSNYLSGGVSFNGGYVSNLYPGSGTSTVNDELYLVSPMISADHSTDRSHETFTYTPAFTFYDHNSELNTVNHTGTAAFQYRLSPHMNFLAGDTLAKTSDTWNQPLSSGSVSGGLPSVTPGIIAPFAPQLSNSAYAQLGWQLSLNDMVGGSGVTSLVNYSQSSSESRGLYNSDARGGSGFYTHRLPDGQYIGATYQYSQIVATPAIANGIAQATLDANTVDGFYTVYPTSALSLSLGGGTQHYQLIQSPAASVNGWAPSAFGSLGWHGLHTSLALSYSHLVTEGAGIIGVYSANTAALSGRWQISRNWTANAGGNYSVLATVARSLSGSVPGGHSLNGTASVIRQFGQQFSIAIQYQRLHQTYSDVAAISIDPNSSRESVSITYHFSRPLGR
jgi:hypothetical protein